MFEFKWNLPGDPARELTLMVHSRSGWFGRKVVSIDGRPIVLRGRFEGVFCRFPHPETGQRLELRLVRVPDSSMWRPALFCDNREIAQTGGDPPPKIVSPPKSIAMPATVVYVGILMAVVSYLPITKILNALYVNHDDCRVALTVLPAEPDEAALRVLPIEFGAIQAGASFSGRFEAAGGTPPYSWSRSERGWPRGITLDSQTGALHGTPFEPRDFSGTVSVIDANENKASLAFAVAVEPLETPGPERPAIHKRPLPAATVGQPYEFTFTAEGGRPAPGSEKIEHAWTTLGKQRLPDGLEFDKETGILSGTPEETFSRSLVVQVHDLSYAAGHDTTPWIIPMLVTGVCLIGYLNMRRASVFVFGALIPVQIAFWALALAFVPISPTALVMETVIWSLGAVHLGKMH